MKTILSSIYGGPFPNNVCNDAWLTIARDSQKPPRGEWNVWLILAGRGFGKTRAAAEAVRRWVLDGKYRRVALVGATIKEAHDVMVGGESGILSISYDTDNVKYCRSEKKLLWGNGAMATLYGSENYEQLRGPQFDLAWIDEIAKFKYPKETFDQLNFSLRVGENPRMIITTTPRPINFLRDLMARNGVIVTRGTSLENAENISASFMRQLDYLKGSHLEAQEIYGKIVDISGDEIWSFENIESCYRKPVCDLKRVVVAVDPAISSDNQSDETGIIVCGKDELNNCYVLDDLSTRSSSDIWVEKVVAAYYKHHANCVVIEANQGGELIQKMIEKVDQSVLTKNVFASESKIARAMPIANLYRRGKIFHLQQFEKLEEQMISLVSMKTSPDRVDAMVWGMRELLNIPSSSLYCNLWESVTDP